MKTGGTDWAQLASAPGRDPDVSVSLADVRAVVALAADLVGALRPEDVLFSECVEMWDGFARLANLGSAGQTLLARRVDESGAWRRAGHRNVDEYLASRGGESVGDARKQRQASERLKELPDTEGELRKGTLSPGQRDAVTDGAAANPGAEQGLLDGARRNKPLKDLKDDAARAKAAADRDPQATEDRVRRERRLSTFPKSDGSHGVYGQGPVDDVALLEGALKPIVDRLFRENRNDPGLEDRQAYFWDALIELARSGLRNGEPSSDSEPDTRSDRKGDQRGDRRSGLPPYLGIIRMDLAALVRGHVEGDELCEITGLGPIPVTRARELLGESTLRLVLTKGIDVQNVTYLGRGPNTAQKIALLWSQPFCSNVACPNTFCQTDHREGYAVVRKTELDNLDNLCTHCHDLKTYEGWMLVEGKGRRPFVPPDHPLHPKNRDP